MLISAPMLKHWLSVLHSCACVQVSAVRVRIPAACRSAEVSTDLSLRGKTVYTLTFNRLVDAFIHSDLQVRLKELKESVVQASFKLKDGMRRSLRKQKNKVSINVCFIGGSANSDNRLRLNGSCKDTVLRQAHLAWRSPSTVGEKEENNQRYSRK